MKGYEIRRVKNGYVIFVGGFNYSSAHESREPYVFNTLDAALAFLRVEFQVAEFQIGSEPVGK